MPRRRDRVEYPGEGSALGNPYNAERLARAIAIMVAGQPTEREFAIAIEVSRLFSGRVADLEDQTDELQSKLLELLRLIG